MAKIFGKFEFDEARRRLTCHGRPVRLTGQALDLLTMLVAQSGELVTREEIKHWLWPDSSQDLDHSLDVLVNRLRRILGDSGEAPQYIETVPRRGFRFVPAISNSDSADSATHPLLGSFQRRESRPVLGISQKIALLTIIVFLAALGGILFARTRYKRFVPSQRTNPSANPRDCALTCCRVRPPLVQLAGKMPAA